MALSVEITPNHSDLEDENGELLTFGADDWTAGVWERKVQANPSGAEDEIVVKVTSDVPNEDGTTDTVYGRIGLVRDVLAQWDSGSASGGIGEDIEVGWRVTDSNGEELPRCPSGLVSVSYDFTRADGEPEADGDVTIEWYEQGRYDSRKGVVRVMTAGTVRLSIQTTGSDEDLCVVEVREVEQPGLADLVEAIRERYQYIKQAELSLDETSELSEIRAKAVESVQGYLKSYDLDTNTEVSYDSSSANAMFPEAPSAEGDISGWISSCYRAIVKVKRVSSPFSTVVNFKSGKGRGYRDSEYDKENDEYRWTETEASAKSEARSELNNSMAVTEGSSYRHSLKGGVYLDMLPGSYNPGADCWLEYASSIFNVKITGRLNYNPGGTGKVVAKSVSYSTYSFSKLGCPVPDNGKFGYCGSLSFSSNPGSIESGWLWGYIPTNIGFTHVDYDGGESTDGAYKAFSCDMAKVILTLKFKH